MRDFSGVQAHNLVARRCKSGPATIFAAELTGVDLLSYHVIMAPGSDAAVGRNGYI